MKILQVHNTYRSSGGEDVVVERERVLLQNYGHTVTCYSRSNSEMEGISGLAKLGRPYNLVWSRDTYHAIRQKIRIHRPDVVHVHNTSYVISPSVFAACADASTPVVQTLHNYRLLCPGANFFRDGQVCESCLSEGLLSAVRYGCCGGSRARSVLTAGILFLNRNTPGPDLYIVPSEFTRRKMISAGVPAADIRVKPNFVDHDGGLRFGAGDYAIAIGRLSPEKGFGTLVKGWQHLSLPLKIVGEGPLRIPLENLASPFIQFVGRKSRDELFALLRYARFLVFPSECYETFGMVIAEAFACGVPVLCARGGAAQELVDDHVTGLHFSPGSADDLAQAVHWAWGHPAEMDAMGVRARREYEFRYTAAQNYKLLLSIYSELVRRKLHANSVGNQGKQAPTLASAGAPESSQLDVGCSHE